MSNEQPPYTPEPQPMEPRRPSGTARVLKLLGLLLAIGTVTWLVYQLFFNHPAPAPNPMANGMPVTMTEVQPQAVVDSTAYLADITSDNATGIRAQVAGRIQKVLVTDGQRVRAGQALFQLDASQQAPVVAGLSAATQVARQETNLVKQRIASLNAERTGLQAQVDFQRKQTERYQALAQTQSASAKDVEQAQTALTDLQNRMTSVNASIAEQHARLAQVGSQIRRESSAEASARANLAFYTVRAPYAGVVGDIRAKAGDVVDPSVVLTSITSGGPLEISVAIPSQDAHKVHVGMPLQVRNTADEVLATTTVSSLMPSVDPMSQTIVVKGLLPKPVGLQVDERVKLALVWGEAPAIVVPASAVIRMAGQAFIYTVQDGKTPDKTNAGDKVPAARPGAQPQPPQKTAHLRPIELGRMTGDGYVVKSGLHAGEVIVTGGVQKLRGDGIPVMQLPPDKPHKPRNWDAAAEAPADHH